MGLAAFTGYFFLSSYLPLLWGATLAQFQVLDLTGLGKWGGAAAGLLMYEAGVYLWPDSLCGINRETGTACSSSRLCTAPVRLATSSSTDLD